MNCPLLLLLSVETVPRHMADHRLHVIHIFPLCHMEAYQNLGQFDLHSQFDSHVCSLTYVNNNYTVCSWNFYFFKKMCVRAVNIQIDLVALLVVYLKDKLVSSPIARVTILYLTFYTIYGIWGGVEEWVGRLVSDSLGRVGWIGASLG